MLTALLALLPLTATLEAEPAPLPPAGAVIHRIAFGSCLHPCGDHRILEAALATRPDLFLFIGDNVYADLHGQEAGLRELRAAYATLASSASFQALRRGCPLLATWDDHDYGLDDGGADFLLRAESQQVFLDFFAEPPGSPRRRREGVHDAHLFGPPGRRLQLILLDTRYHRGPLCPARRRPTYEPNPDPTASMLGEEQWAWLEHELARPAELRLLVSSVQVLPEQQPFEKWANLPLERRRLLDLLDRHPGLLLLSGDRHQAELTWHVGGPGRGAQPVLPELTSSSLNLTIDPRPDPSRERDGDPVFTDNYGLVEIDWEGRTVTLEIHDRSLAAHLRRRIPFAMLGRPQP